MSAGYDIGLSESTSTAQNAQMTAPTIINFGDKANVDGGWYGQTNEQTPVAVASKGPASAGVESGGGGLGALGSNKNMLLYGAIAIAGVVAVVLIVKASKKKS